MGAVVSDKTIFQKKKSFAKAIADMHDAEVFGIGCDDKWRCLLKDYVILDVLETYKKKCYNPCFDFETLGAFRDLTGTGIEIVVDNFNFDFVVGDVLNIISESLELLDTVDYEIESITYYTDMINQDKTIIDNAGFSENSVKITLVGFNDISEVGITGSLYLKTPKEIVNDNRELIQEDVNCLIGKIC